MIAGVIEWWCDLSRRGKYLLSGFFILISAGLLLNGTIWIWGWAVGGVLLVCTFLKVGEDAT